MKSKSTYQLKRGLLQTIGISLLIVFINFTVVVPCLSITGLDVNLTEMVEEEIEEQEQHQTNLHDLMVSSLILDGEEPSNDKSFEIALVHHPEVLTPPPELA